MFNNRLIREILHKIILGHKISSYWAKINITSKNLYQSKFNYMDNIIYYKKSYHMDKK